MPGARLHTICNFPAYAVAEGVPFAKCQYAPAKVPKPIVRVRKMVKNITFVLSDAMRYTKHSIPIKTRKKAGLTRQPKKALSGLSSTYQSSRGRGLLGHHRQCPIRI